MKLELSCKFPCFTQYISYLHPKEEDSSSNIDRFIATSKFQNSKTKMCLAGLMFDQHPPNFEDLYNFLKCSNDIIMILWYLYWFQVFKVAFWECSVHTCSCPCIKCPYFFDLTAFYSLGQISFKNISLFFVGDLKATKGHFEINWPLARKKRVLPQENLFRRTCLTSEYRRGCYQRLRLQRRRPLAVKEGQGKNCLEILMNLTAWIRNTWSLLVFLVLFPLQFVVWKYTKK